MPAAAAKARPALVYDREENGRGANGRGAKAKGGRTRGKTQNSVSQKSILDPMSMEELILWKATFDETQKGMGLILGTNEQGYGRWERGVTRHLHPAAARRALLWEAYHRELTIPWSLAARARETGIKVPGDMVRQRRSSEVSV